MLVDSSTAPHRRLRAAFVLGLSASFLCGFRAQAQPQNAPPEEPTPAVTIEPPAAQQTLPNPEAMDYVALADAPVFLPRSYLYWGSPTGARQHLVFALEYALHLPAYNDLRRKALQGKRWAGAANLSFEGNLRMLAEPSKPVRMPSYRPSITGQLFYLWHRPYPVLFGVRMGLFHYSNGQEGCTFDVNEQDGTRACDEANANVTDPAEQLNRRTGNFATNGYIFEANARIHRLNRRGVAVSHLGFGLGLAGNFRTGHAGFAPYLRRFYGWGPLYAQLEMRHLLGKSALTLRARVTGYPDSGPKVPKASGELEGVFSPVWLVGFGLFLRYFGGRDFYNAFFVDRIEQFSAGLAWDGERPLKFRQN